MTIIVDFFEQYLFNYYLPTQLMKYLHEIKYQNRLLL